MAGDKSLDVYAIFEAEKYYRQALTVFEAQKTCSDQPSVAHVVVRLLETLNNKSEFRQVEEAARKFMPIVNEGGDTPELVIGRCLQVTSLLRTRDIRGAHEFSLETLKIAERVGDVRARAMASGNLLFMRSFLGPDLLDPAERMKTELIDDCVRVGDSIILCWSYFSIAWDYLYRGLIVEAREVAARLVTSGEERRDPRGIGYANLLLSYMEEMCDDPVSATGHAEECIRVAVAPDERRQASMVKAVSGIFLGRVREGLEEVDALNLEFERSGALMAMQCIFQGIGLAMLGRVSEGIRMIEKEIAQADATGDQTRAAMSSHHSCRGLHRNSIRQRETRGHGAIQELLDRHGRVDFWREPRPKASSAGSCGQKAERTGCLRRADQLRPGRVVRNEQEERGGESLL